MANKVCILPEQEKELREAISRGDFSLAKIKNTKSSAERFDLVNNILKNEELSKKVVREMEKRLTSQKEDIIKNYMDRTFTSVPENTRKGVFNKFKRMSQFLGAKEEKDFLEELVAHKFGAYITKEEANNFEKLVNEAIILKEKIPTDATDITPESLAYGQKLVELENAEARVIVDRAGFNVSDYKKNQGKTGAEAIAGWSDYLIKGGLEAAATTRSFLATGDLSAIFRQLWKVFSSGIAETVLSAGTKNDKLKIWWKATKTGWDAVKKTGKYGDFSAYDAIRAQIHADPNSYNGVYDAATNGYALRVRSEEQFPSSIPSEIFDKASKKGNLFKMSEVAFNATVLQARYDLANLTIKQLKDGGSNVMDKDIADAAGEFVSAFTGRGGLGKFESAASNLNKVFFAPKYAASQFSPYNQIIKGLTTKANNPAARLAAVENAKYLVGSVALIATAEFAKSLVTGEEPDYTASLNPMSNSFGKVTIPGTDRSVDFTGGNRSVVGLLTASMTTNYYDSRLGVWREKSIMQAADGKPLYDFVTGKFAPVPSIILNLKKGEHFGGKEVSAESIVSRLLIPITVANFWEEANTKESDLSTAMTVLLAEGIGMSASDIRFKPQNDEWKALLNTDEKAYWRAVDELWKTVHFKSKILRQNEEFQALPRDKQAEKMEKMYNRELDRVIHQDQYRDISKEKLEEIKAKK